jgi:hypothetical protein
MVEIAFRRLRFYNTPEKIQAIMKETLRRYENSVKLIRDILLKPKQLKLLAFLLMY